MQAEREDRKPARGAAAQFRPLQQELPENRRTAFGVRRRDARELVRRAAVALELLRGLTDEPSCPLFSTHTERRLDPRRQRMGTKRLVVVRRRRASLDGGSEGADHLGVADVCFGRGSFQGLPDDLRRIEWDAKEHLGDVRDVALLVAR